MRAKTEHKGQVLFRSRLENIVDPRHELVRVARAIDWQSFEERFGPQFADGAGRPAMPTRLMVGLQYLKYTFNESDEGVVARFLENPYWQYFCGNEYFEHRFPCSPTSLVRWRGYIGSSGSEVMIKETIELALRAKVAKPADFEHVNIDTTVQPKNVRHPTDAKLYDRARQVLVRVAEKAGVKLRQTDKYVARKTLCRSRRPRAPTGSSGSIPSLETRSTAIRSLTRWCRSSR